MQHVRKLLISHSCELQHSTSSRAATFHSRVKLAFLRTCFTIYYFLRLPSKLRFPHRLLHFKVDDFSSPLEIPVRNDFSHRTCADSACRLNAQSVIAAGECGTLVYGLPKRQIAKVDRCSLLRLIIFADY